MGLGALSHCRRSHADAAARVPARSESRASRARRSHSARRVDVQGDAAADGAHPSRRAAGSYRFRALSRAARPLMAQVRQPLGPPSRRRRVRRSRRPGRRGECLHQAKQTRKRQRGGHRRRRRRAPPFAIAHPRGFWFRSIRPGRPRSRVRVGSDPLGASDGGVRRLRGRGSPAVPHPATRRGSRAAAHGGGGGGVGAQSIGNLGGGGPRRASRWLGRLRGDERRARARARRRSGRRRSWRHADLPVPRGPRLCRHLRRPRRARRAMAFDPD